MRIRRNTGSMAGRHAGMGFTAQAARRMMLTLTILGVLAFSVGVGFTVVQRAGATPVTYDVCASGCTYTKIQDAINNVNPTLSTALTTITVGPGTYNENVTINRTVTLDGANMGVDPNTGSRGAESIINAGGSSAAAVTITAANVVVDGFTITGSTGGSFPSAGIYGPSSSGAITVSNNIIDNNWNGINDIQGTTVTVTHNHFQDNSSQPTKSCTGSGPTRCNAFFQNIGFTTTVVTYNTFDQSNATAFQRALSINPYMNLTPSAAVQIEHNTIYNMSTIAYVTGDFSYNTQTGGPFGLKIGGAVNNFGIQNNTFTGLNTSAIAMSNWYKSAYESNLTITGNTVTQDVGVLAPGWIYPSLDVATFDLDTLSGSNTVSNNTIIYSGTYPASGISVQAIHLRSQVTGAVNITGNTFEGGNVGGANTDGLLIDAGAKPPTATNNIFRQFAYGVNDQTGSVFTLGTNNCITGNSSYGYSATGAYANSTDKVNAQSNWWGSSYGPGTTPGYGNPVTTHVDATHFLTSSPMAACAGPVTSNVQSSSNPVTISTHYTLTATLDTTSTSNLPVASAYYKVDGGLAHSMSATSGTFNTSKVVTVSSGTLTSLSTPGTHSLCVYGIDTALEVGSPVCITLSIVYPTVNTTTTITSSANPSLANQSVTFTITVASPSGTPTGSVTLMDGANTLVGPLTLDNTGAATFTTSALTVGTHPLVANYSGDTSGNPIFQASTSATLNQVVNKVDTTTTLTAAPNPSVSGQTVTFSVTVHATDGSTPSGTVTLSEGATQLGVITLASGAGTFTTSTLSIGTHNISAAYSGDTTHNTSSGAATATVGERPTVPTGTDNAFIRFVQASEAHTTSDIAIDGKVTFPNVAACTAQAYFPIVAGSHTITVQFPSGGTTVITQSLKLTAGAYYTIAIVGNSAKSITPALLVFSDNNTVTPNQATVRIYHLSDTLGNVEAKAGSTVLAANLTFGHATGYNSHGAGTETYTFQPASGPAVNDTLKLEANQVYSIFLMCDGQAVNAVAAGVPQSLPQTGYGQAPMWLQPQLSVALLIAGLLALLAAGGSWYVVARRNRAAL